MLHSFQYDGKAFTIELQNDFYGSGYWDRVAKSEYEPDTLDFLKRNCEPGTTFMDVGAANGAMTLIAASLGATVFSYEPDPLMFRVTAKNVSLNPNAKGRVELINSALSANEGELNFSKGSNSQVLTDIVFSGNRSEDSFKVAINSISDEISRIHKDGSPLVIKMDIEGAEWGILSDPESLKTFANHKAIILLAVHPGFHRPHKKIAPVINRTLFEIWRAQNYFEAKNLFSNISQYASIKRTNLNLISSPNVFAGLCLVGYHEFVIEFKK